MIFSFLAALLWISGGLAIRYSLPTWVLVLYCFISVVSLFALATVRYGLLYGPGTWYEHPVAPALHVDAAAHAALLAMTRGAGGAYNIADDDGVVSIAKAQAALGFDPAFLLQ